MPKWEKGIVDWFDSLSGEGMIRSNDGRFYYVHYSAIQTEKKRKSLKKQQPVSFVILEEETPRQVAKVKEL